MEKLTEIQEFRAATVAAVGFNVKKAQEVCDFVLDGATHQPTMNINVQPSEEGLFYILNDKSVAPVSSIDLLDKKTIVGVAIKAMGRVASVALHDAADGNDVALIDEDKECSETPGEYKKSFKEAMSDWDGEGNTKRLRTYLNPKIDLKDNEYIPSVAQMHLILLFINEINKALVLAGGDELQAGYHWSSTEYSSGSAWYVYFYSGGTHYNHKYTYFTVRPSVACEL